MLLVAFVDDGAGGLEACPDLFAELFGDGSRLPVFLVQLLQLVEGADDIRLVGQFLRRLAEAGLLLEVLLEVVFARLPVEVQQVIELLDVELVVPPQFVRFLCRHHLDFFPFLLQLLELVEVLVGFLGCRHHRLDLFDDALLPLEVLLFLLFEGEERFLAFLLDDGHLGLEGLFVLVGQHLEFLRVASVVEVGLLLCFPLGEMQLVEGRLEMVHFGLFGCLVAAGDFLQAFYDFLLGTVCLRRGVFLPVFRLCFNWLVLAFFSRVSLSVLCPGLFCGCGSGNFFRQFSFFRTLVQGILLRVHHFTCCL